MYGDEEFEADGAQFGYYKGLPSLAQAAAHLEAPTQPTYPLPAQPGGTAGQPAGGGSGRLRHCASHAEHVGAATPW